MIRSMSTRDSSLSLRMTRRVVFCHCSRVNPPFLLFWTSQSSFIVILNELLGEEESLQRVVRQSSENVIEFYLWFVPWVLGILRYRSEWQAKGVFFVIVHEPFLLYCHSERAFGRGRIPGMWVKVWVLKILSPFKHDSFNEYAGFFAIAQNDMPGCFCHSERDFQSQNRSILSMPLFFCGITSLLPHR